MQRFQSSSVAMNDLQGQVDNLLERVAQLEHEKLVLQDQDEQVKKRVQELHNSWVAWSETIIDSIRKEENRAQIVENDMFTLRVSLNTIRLWIDNPNVDATRDMAALRSALGSVRLWADMRPATARRPLAAEA
jgi:predicted nuclease with TOPRIM domain